MSPCHGPLSRCGPRRTRASCAEPALQGRGQEARSIQKELDVYNELLPDAGELAATLLVEITEESRIQTELDRLIGITRGDKLCLDIDGKRVFARFLPGQSRDDRMAAVQYMRFPVGRDGAMRTLLESAAAGVILRVNHPSYVHEAELSPGTRREIAQDID